LGHASKRNTHSFCCKYQQNLALTSAEQKISDKKRYWTSDTSLVSPGFQVLGPWGSSTVQAGTQQSSGSRKAAQLPPLQLIRPTGTNLGSPKEEHRTANYLFKKQIFSLHFTPK